jgi:uncharacterized protein YciI
MRPYVLVLLRSSGHPVPAGPARDAMFQGHFANIGRLAQAGTLALAGPADGVEGLRGLFVLAVPDIDAARAIVDTDPVIREGEMVAEYHRFYGTAALMALYEIHQKLQAPRPPRRDARPPGRLSAGAPAGRHRPAGASSPPAPAGPPRP